MDEISNCRIHPKCSLLHLKNNQFLVTRHMKEVCVRTHILLRLGCDLIETIHPALVKRSDAGPVPRAAINRIKAAYQQMVDKHYPTSSNPEDAECGVLPAVVRQVCEESTRATQRHSPLHEKNATPPPGSTSTDVVFDAMLPQMVVPERHADAGTNVAEIGHAAQSESGDIRAPGHAL